MEPRTIAKQAIDYHRAAVENSFSAMLLLQEQTARMADAFCGQAAALQTEGTKVLNECVKAQRKGCEDFKKVVDDNFKTVEAFFADTGKAEKAETK
jgi:hypothetical protein